MSGKPLIGLLSTNLEPVPFYNCCIDMPVVICKFKPGGIDWVNERIKAIVLLSNEWKKAVVRFPDAIYNRCYSNFAKVTGQLEKAVGSGKVFNIISLFDKLIIYNILKDSSLSKLVIPTYRYRADLMLSLLKSEGTVLIKPAKGSLASGVYKIEAEGGEYKAYLRTVLSSKAFNNSSALMGYIEGITKSRDYVIQPYINFARLNGHIFDIRMLVQKNLWGQWDVTAYISRVGYKSSFVSNHVYSLKPVEDVLSGVGFDDSLVSVLKKVSINAARILESKLCHLGEISVDFGIGADGRLWIIEINGKPDKEIFCSCSSDILDRVYRTPVEYALYLARH